MNIKTLFKANIVISILSLVGLYFLDYPLELIPMTGIAWVLISSVEEIRKLNSSKTK
jgi:hypothetical protein